MFGWVYYSFVEELRRDQEGPRAKLGLIMPPLYHKARTTPHPPPTILNHLILFACTHIVLYSALLLPPSNLLESALTSQSPSFVSSPHVCTRPS